MTSFNRVSRPAALAVAITAALVCVPALAETAADPQSLDTVVVTGSRGEQTLEDALASTTVIDRAEIERRQATSLLDLLRGEAGISLSNNGGAGKNTSLYLRGTESDHTLVLIDGMRVGSATSGGAAWQDIPLDQIERIEIVRGPYSSLYGSDAIGGVVQIFTRRPQGAFTPEFSVSAGSQGTVKASAGVSGRGARSWYALNLAHAKTDGFNACNGKPSPGGAGCFVYEFDRDGYRNDSVSALGGFDLGEAWKLEGNALRAEGRNHYDGSFVNEADIVQQVLGARATYRGGAGFKLAFNAGQSVDSSENFHDGIWRSNFETRRLLAGVQADFNAGSARFVTGFDWYRDEVGSDNAYALDRRSNSAVFGQWQQDFGAHALQLSARRDDNSQFGGKTTGSLQWGWQFTDALRVSASYGTAFKAPTFNELYYPGYGNPDLLPESSNSAEIGLRGTHGKTHWGVNAYRTRIDGLIAFDASIFAPGNVDRARIRGVEVTGDTELAGWNLHGALTWLDPENASRGYDGLQLPRRARRSGRIDLDRTFGSFDLGASLFGASHRYDDLRNQRPLGGYATTDLRLGWKFDPAWKLQLAVENIFDRNYQTAAFYNQPGRTWLLTLRYRGR